MIPDGIYLRLPFEDYIAEDALGGTDEATLALRGPGWWWKTRAPYRPPRKHTAETLFGEAAHAALLEGMHAYESRFIVKPDKDDYGADLITSIDAVKKRLKTERVPLHGTSSWETSDWLDAADTYLPDVPVWPAIMAEFERRSPGRQGISAFDDFAIRTMRDLVISEAHEHEEMRELFSVGSSFPILAEVSVFYTDAEGIRHRARFDKLLPVAIVDMKTVGEWRGRPLDEALHEHIVRNGYDVQLASYHVARQAMNRMLLEDPDRYLFGGTEEERTHMVAMAEWNQTNRWGWLWAFYQKPDAGGNAPILFPLRDPWKGPYHLNGFRKRHAGLQTYKRYVAEFGLDKPWGKVEPIHYVDEGAKHHIITTPFGWANDPVEGEEDHFQTPDYEPRRIISKGDYLA